MSPATTTKPFQTFLAQVKSVLPTSNIILDEAQRLIYATDASFYRIVPKCIVIVDSEQQLQGVLTAAREQGVAVCFRAAGTSLSGQALTPSVLIKLSEHWQDYQIVDHGRLIKMQCGLLGSQANHALKPFHRVLGPMPASIDSATVGGMAINNAAGMNSLDTYGQMRDVRIILANGNVIDTEEIRRSDTKRAEFEQENKALIAAISDIVARLRSAPALMEKIKLKYRIKNTTGYSLRALIDYDDILDVISHLLVGSEGTLGFISHITHETINIMPHKAASLVLFESLESAGQAVIKLKHLNANGVNIAAAELIDGRALRAVKHQPGMPSILSVAKDSTVALLVQVEGQSLEQVNQGCAAVAAQFANLALLADICFEHDACRISDFWQMRKAIFPAVGANRQPGTTALIEDVAFPIESLPNALNDLQQLLQRAGYSDAVIYGHAFDGNLHFIFSQRFDTQQDIEHYAQLMEDVVALVVDKYQGSIKAEHGTGRNMAPFVKREWGEDLYQIMQQIKAAFDPQGLLNPEVILTADPKLFVKDIKPLVAGNELIDKCIECGFCERQCPSKHLTFTPRQRVVTERLHLTQAASRPDSAKTKSSLAYQYSDTCAGCGLCETSCPVDINVGELVKQYRQQVRIGKARRTSFAGVTNELASLISKYFAISTQLTRWGVRTGYFLQKSLSKAFKLNWPTLPNPQGNYLDSAVLEGQRSTLVSTRVSVTNAEDEKVVLYVACIERVFGSQAAFKAVVSVLNKAGYEVIIPESINQQCCGLPFSSKGFPDHAKQKSETLSQELTVASEQGRWPIVFDTSQCHGHFSAHSTLATFDPITFIAEHALPRLTILPKQESVAYHLTCSARKAGQLENIKTILSLCAPNAILPDDISCCGFAGDKGFSVPELNRSALAKLKSQVSKCEQGYSTSRTCEIGLMHHSGIEYGSIFNLLDEVSQ